jgi:alanine transaminase
MVHAAFEKMEGVSCTPPISSMYLFPRFRYPKRFVDHALLQGKTADSVYCMELLNETGISVVPGSGFGQYPGTWHIRTTFLPDEKNIEGCISRWSSFHSKFIDKWTAKTAMNANMM